MILVFQSYFLWFFLNLQLKEINSFITVPRVLLCHACGVLPADGGEGWRPSCCMLASTAEQTRRPVLATRGQQSPRRGFHTNMFACLFIYWFVFVSGWNSYKPKMSNMCGGGWARTGSGSRILVGPSVFLQHHKLFSLFSE